MNALFALEFTLNGIRLTYLLNGSWTVLGDVGVAAPDLKQRLSEIVHHAEGLQHGPIVADVVLPRTHVRYEVLPWDAGGVIDQDAIRRRMVGMVPFVVDELLFDWVEEEGLIRLAIIEAVTLREVDDFVRKHGVTPACMTARPWRSEFPRAPVFALPPACV